MKKNIKPPRLADRLFERYCKQAHVEDLHGDVEELFYENLKNMPVRKAKFYYWQQIISLIFSYAVRRRKQRASTHAFSSTSFNPALLKNYFLIASRSLVKHRFFSIINIVGLAVGMSVSLLLIAFLSFIWRYDAFQVNKDNIFRIISKTDYKSERRDLASAPLFLAAELKNGYSGIDQVVRISKTLNAEAEFEDKEFPLSGYYVDPGFLQVFTFPLLKGNKDQVLERPNTLVITERVAKIFFGDEEPVGKEIQLNKIIFEVSGVLENPPKNSHMQFEALASFQSLEGFGEDPSEQNLKEFRNQYTYLQLPPHTDKRAIERYLNNVAASANGDKDFSISFELQNLKDITPGPQLSNSIGPDWDKTSLIVFGFIALLILLPASFNYANISIAQSLKRMKETGIRKVMGGLQGQILLQFIVETIIIALIALGIAFYLFTLIRREFLSMLVSGDAISLDLDLVTIFYFIIFALVVGLATGFVPAYYFSRLNPVQAMKKKLVRNTSGFGFRRSLTVFQFALSLGFITSVVIVLSQYRQTVNYDFGFQQANILDVPLQGASPNVIRNEFSTLAGVRDISMSSYIMGIEGRPPIYLKNAQELDSIQVFQMHIDDRYIPNLNLKLIAGKNFERNKISENQIIVNEEFLKNFQLSDASQAIGRVYLLEGKAVEVIGVVKNFHYAQLIEPIRSFVFSYDASKLQVANVKLASHDILGTLTDMEALWKPLVNEKKFTARFFDEEIEEAYDYYFTMVKICGFLGFLAITISCLGLLGMVVLTTENRTKEVGIRKVMGATTFRMVAMLSKDFIKLILIATCIALPITYLFFDKVYLSRQYYKIPIGIGEMLIGIAIILILGLITILSQTTRTAQSNPVDTLKCE